jgi:hypothetical protein
VIGTLLHAGAGEAAAAARIWAAAKSTSRRTSCSSDGVQILRLEMHLQAYRSPLAFSFTQYVYRAHVGD